MDINTAIENLKKHGFEVSFFQTPDEAAAYVNSQLDSRSIGFGGSMTVKEMGLFRMLQKHNDVCDKTVPENAARAMAHDAAADVYVTSANAISQTGEIVNIDGIGNRLAAMMYGKQAVYIIVGINKFTDTLDSAIFRARNVAAPKNAQRLHKNTPCALKADKCYDCSCPERICRGMSVLYRATTGVGRYEVIIVNQELGY